MATKCIVIGEEKEKGECEKSIEFKMLLTDYNTSVSCLNNPSNYENI